MGAPPWSATRARTFQDCRRRYYFRYHLAPQGRRPGAPPEAVEADRLKDLVGLEAWAGELVHHVIETVLNRWRAGREYGEDEAVAEATRLLSRQFRDSAAYWTAQPEEYPRRPPLLDLHFYGDGSISRDRAAAIKETVTGSVRAFLRSDLAATIRRVGPAEWRPVDRNAAARLDDDLLILVKPDFAFTDGGRLHIVDWKTGRPDPFWEMVQITCYALYAREKWGYQLGEIVPRIVHLFPEFRVSETEYTEDSIRDVQLFIHESQDEITALIEGPAMPPAERFPYTEDGKRCRWCPFRGVCDGALRVG